MRKNIKKVLSIVLPLIITGLTAAIVGSYIVNVYAEMSADEAVVETLQGFMLVMPPQVKRALRIGGVVILLSVFAGFAGYMSADN